MNTNSGFSPERGFFRAADKGAGGGGVTGGDESGSSSNNEQTDAKGATMKTEKEILDNVLPTLRTDIKQIDQLIDDIDPMGAIEVLKQSQDLAMWYEASSPEEAAALAFFKKKLREKAGEVGYSLGNETNEANGGPGLTNDDEEKKPSPPSPPGPPSPSSPPGPPSPSSPPGPPVSPEEFNQMEEFRKLSLKDLFSEWQSESIEKGDEIRFMLRKVITEKAKAMKPKFVEKALAARETAEVGEKRAEAFVELLDHTFILIDYQVLSGHSLNTVQLTAKHEELIQSLNKDGAVAVNVEFNKNPLVNSGSVDRQQYSDDMGIVQMMVYAAYQQMRKKDGDDDEYTRNQSFTADKAEKLFFEYLAQLDSFQIVDETEDATIGGQNRLISAPSQFGSIKRELEKFPDEAKEMICFIARLKTTRDDLGSKAGLWHLGRHKGAMKHKKGEGESGKPTGLLSSILYNVGKNGTSEMSKACLTWIDPRNIETMVDGRETVALGDISTEKTLYNLWNNPPNDERSGPKSGSANANQKVLFAAEEMHSYLNWYNEKAWRGFKRYEPEHWDDDYPGIDVLVNQVKNAALASDYEGSKAAFLEIVETANKVFSGIKLSGDISAMTEQIHALVKNFGTNVAIAFSFIGNRKAETYKPDDKKYNLAHSFKRPATDSGGGVIKDKDGKTLELITSFEYCHKLIATAFKFYIFGILSAVPGEQPLVGPKKSEYESLYSAAQKTIIEYLTNNSSLSNYKTELVDFTNNCPKREFALELKKQQDIIGFNKWRISNKPELKGLRAAARNKEYDSFPKSPVSVNEGWKTVYQET